jgi:hypothetical protein
MGENTLDLFDRPATYPDAPGHKEKGGTSQAAAETIAPLQKPLQADVLRVLERNPAGLTADEIASRMSRSVLSIRPRVSELRESGLIFKTGERRVNESGCKAWVWKIAPGYLSASLEESRRNLDRLNRAGDALAAEAGATREAVDRNAKRIDYLKAKGG